MLTGDKFMSASRRKMEEDICLLRSVVFIQADAQLKLL
jgi:hypothetical protein